MTQGLLGSSQEAAREGVATTRVEAATRAPSDLRSAVVRKCGIRLIELPPQCSWFSQFLDAAHLWCGLATQIKLKVARVGAASRRAPCSPALSFDPVGVPARLPSGFTKL